MREVEAPTFLDNWLTNGGTHFCQKLIKPQGQSQAGRIKSIKKNLMTSPGTESVTFWLVAWCLYHRHYCMPPTATQTCQNSTVLINCSKTKTE
jgi:hypothetical protein